MICLDNALLRTSAYFRLRQASSIFGFDVKSEDKGKKSMSDIFKKVMIEKMPY